MNDKKVEEIAESFINGNISWVRSQVRNVAVYAKIIDWLEEYAPKEIESFRRLIGDK